MADCRSRRLNYSLRRLRRRSRKPPGGSVPRYRMDRMLRQVVPLVLAAIIGATPLVREFCRTACDGPASAASSDAHHGHAATSDHDLVRHDRGHAAAPATEPAHHAHAELGPPANLDHPRADCCSPAIGPRRDCCEDAGPQVTSTIAPRQAVDPPALTPQIAWGISRTETVLRASVETSVCPPVPLARRTPLRV
jgi:hypothetical protein